MQICAQMPWHGTVQKQQEEEQEKKGLLPLFCSTLMQNAVAQMCTVFLTVRQRYIHSAYLLNVFRKL